MQCPNCGSRIDPPQRSCSHCQADQVEDRLFAMSFWTGGLPGALAGWIVCVMLEWPPFAGAVVGVFAGIALFAVGRRLLRHDGMDAPSAAPLTSDPHWRE